MARWLFFLFAMVGLSSSVQAEIVARNVEYKVETGSFEGVAIYDNATTAKRPGVLVAHEMGANSTLARTRAGQFAKLGYAVFSVDLYGKGVAPKDIKEAASKGATLAKDRKSLRSRVAAGLEAFSKQPQVDAKQVAAIGYGVGGTAVLELARLGAAVEGVVAIHGDLTATTPGDAKKIGASVLVIVGSDDPLIPTAQMIAFEDEMRKGGVDWQVLRLGGVVHDFTNPLAGRDAKNGSAYDSDADKRTSDTIKSFLAETFTIQAEATPAPVGKTPPATVKTPATPPAKTPAPAGKGIPDKVLKVLKYVDDNGEAMEGYEGGRNFGNFERRLPQTDDKGRRIKYREWDVNPLRPGVNRGAERMITGSDGSAYYTDDHYNTFKKIR